MKAFFATCARGLEPVLAHELSALGARDVAAGRGGVHFKGDQALLYRANLWLRTAIRVLVPILDAPVASPDELYQAVQTIDWSHYMTPEHTLAVDCNVRDSHLTHSKYAALKVKDAICDQFVAKVGRRPSVNVEQPMVGLNLHVYKDQAILSLDSTGETLHKRGYRPIQTKAPLNEALAAGLVLLTGWRDSDAAPSLPAAGGEGGGDGSKPGPLIDPLCGSGTLCIEAAWIALNRPPGLTRRHFGFMGWMDFDVRLWTVIRDQARAGVKNSLAAPVLGFDVRRDAVAFSQGNARAAGIGHLLHFDRKDVADFRPPDGPPGVILCNPPYGERIGEEKEWRGLYQTMGKVFQERCQGWQVFVFTGNAWLARFLDMKPAEQIHLFNGKIPCRLLKFLP